MVGYATLILLSKKQAIRIEEMYECKKLKGILDPERAIFKPENTYTIAAMIAI